MTSRILVVEDSATQAEAVRSLLEDRYDLTVASSAEEALDVLGRETFQLVLSDIVMPGMSGYDLCRRIKAHPEWQGTPVVLLTSLIDPLDIVRGLEAGADNYITKPFEAEHLLSRIEHVLSNQRKRRASRTSMEVSVNFLGTELSITSDKEQILDLLLSSIEDIIHTNRALEESRRELTAAHQQLELYAREKEREAVTSTERYSTLMQHAGDAILVLRPDGTITEANASAADLLQRRPNEIIGYPLERFVVAPQRAAVRKSIDALANGKRVAVAERALERADGSAVICEGSATRVEVGDEHLVLAIYRDITDRKESEAMLNRQRTHLREAQEIARLGSWERDVETGLSTFTFTGDFGAILGFPAGESLRPFSEVLDLVHPDDRELVEAASRQASEEGRGFELEFRMLPTTGGTRIVSVRGRAELGDDGRPRRVLGVMQDITDRRALERQLLQAQKMEAVGRLAGGIAHDFNNVLMAVKGSLHFLLEDLGQDHPSREDLDDIGSAVERATRLTRQLLAFSRQQVMQPRVLELAELVREQHRMLRRLVPGSIEIRTGIAHDLWPVMADPSQMEQVLMNLVVNARDAMPDGGSISIDLTNEAVRPGSAAAIAGVEPGEYVLLTVSDTGTGIEDDVLEHIFEPFFTTKESLGTGLGLATVYGIVRQSRGHVIVDGNAGAGAVFNVYIPRATAEADDASEPGDPARSPHATGTILLVEDQPEVRRGLARVLRRFGHVVHEASGGAEALELIETGKDSIDVVVSDIVMPGMNGIQLADRLRSDRPDLPFLLMSGYLDDDSRDSLSRAGAQYIEKPFEQEELIRRIGVLLSRST